MALGRPAWSAVRARLQSALAAEGEAGADAGAATAVKGALAPAADFAMQLPATIGD
jgi:fumarylacetoacetase